MVKIFKKCYHVVHKVIISNKKERIPNMSEVAIKIIIEAAISAGIAVLLIFAMRYIIRRLSAKRDGIHLKFFQSFFTVLVMGACIFHILSLFDVTKGVSKTLLQSSALLLAVATFAAQQALGNVISGLFITASHPYNINEKIKVMSSGGSLIAEGLVYDITIRHTVIKTFDGQSAIIPNSVMDSAVIINTNYTENVGNFLEVTISYDADVELASNVLKRIVIEHPLTLNTDDMKVNLSRFESSGVVLKTTVWAATVDDNFTACNDIRMNILKEFKLNRITIPYNTITIENGRNNY